MSIEQARQSILDKQSFPRLKPQNLCVTSEKTGPTGYNCIAWAACDPQKWWWPKKLWFWPHQAKRELTLAAFIEAYETAGFQVCKDGGLEENFEKVAIYVKDQKPTHAARQLTDGTWTSKLGADEDIIHKAPDDLGGGIYGQPAAFMRRKKVPYSPENPGPSGFFVRRILGDALGKLK